MLFNLDSSRSFWLLLFSFAVLSKNGIALSLDHISVISYWCCRGLQEAHPRFTFSCHAYYSLIAFHLISFQMITMLALFLFAFSTFVFELGSVIFSCAFNGFTFLVYVPTFYDEAEGSFVRCAICHAF